MLDLEVSFRFLLALALGIFIGLEREMAGRLKKISFAGIRTYPLIALFGAISTFLAPSYPWLPHIGFAIIAAILGIAYLMSARLIAKVGITSEIAALITYLLGVVVMLGEFSLAVFLGVVVVLLLHSRYQLHNFAKHVTPEEIYATIQFSVLAFVVLPLLPNRGMGPLDAINPYELWFFVVLMLGVSFIGYIFMKMFGKEKGLIVTAVSGGLVNGFSASYALIQKKLVISHTLVSLFLVNCSILVRGIVLLSIYGGQTLYLIVLLIPNIFLSYWYFIHAPSTNPKPQLSLGSPLSYKPAFQFTLLFAMLNILIVLFSAYPGAQIIPVLLAGLLKTDGIINTSSLVVSSHFQTLVVSVYTIGCLRPLLLSIFLRTSGLTKALVRPMFLVVCTGFLLLAASFYLA